MLNINNNGEEKIKQYREKTRNNVSIDKPVNHRSHDLLREDRLGIGEVLI